jgi:hypothetical protein
LTENEQKQTLDGEQVEFNVDTTALVFPESVAISERPLQKETHMNRREMLSYAATTFAGTALATIADQSAFALERKHHPCHFEYIDPDDSTKIDYTRDAPGQQQRASVPPEAEKKVNEDQFYLFQFQQLKEDGPVLLVPSTEIKPQFYHNNEKGSEHDVKMQDNEHDIAMDVNLESFHISHEDRPQHKSDVATMRLTVGESPVDHKLEPLFWAITAGLQLYDKFQGKPAEAKDLAISSQSSFGTRGVQIKGGLSTIQFEVVTHPPTPTWLRILGFLSGSEAGGQLVAAFGLPALTLPALQFLNGLANNIVAAQAETLFKSRPIKFALTKEACSKYEMGESNVTLPSLRKGLCVLVRGEDYKRVNEANVIYEPLSGRLIKQKDKGSPEKYLCKDYQPFTEKDVTYSVLHIDMVSCNLLPPFEQAGTNNASGTNNGSTRT